MAEGRLQWHPAFSAALHIELKEELENLYIEEEHTLSKKENAGAYRETQKDSL